MSTHYYIPNDHLKPFVNSFVVSHNEGARSYKVLPGTSIVMGFQFSGNLSFSLNNRVHALSKAGITGLIDTYRVFNNTADTGSVLVMFSEAGASAFFPIPMHEIFDQSLSLGDLLLDSQMDVVVERLCEANNDLSRIAVIEDFLLSRLKPRNDELVLAAVRIIKHHSGNIKMKAVAEMLHISISRFEKRFRQIVGTSPKKYANIVRLSNILKANPTKNRLTDLAFDAGYYDQPHFIKDFKAFTGQIPEQFFKEK